MTKTTESRLEKVAAGQGVPTGVVRIQKANWTPERLWRRIQFAVITLVNLAVFFTIWELFARTERIPNIIFPRFTDVLTTLKIGWFGGANLEGFQNRLLDNYVIVQNLWASLKVYGISMLISIGVGIPLGLVMGARKQVEAVLSPYVWTLSSLPRIAIYPILVMFMGIGNEIKYAVVILTAIFPIIINTWSGVKTTEQSLINAAKVFGASRSQIYRKVVLPYTLPFVVTGIQLGLSRGLVGVVVAEFLSGATRLGGLGWLVFRSAAAFNAPLTYASLLSLAVLALVLVQGTKSLEARIAPWRQATKT